MSEEEMTRKSDSITIKKDALWKYSTFILAAIVVIGAFISFTGDNGGAPTGAVINNPGQQLPPTQAQATVDDDAVLGDKNAPVTIIEFSDYQCPYCSRVEPTLKQIKTEYIDTGKVKLVYRDFPLTSIHPNAQKAAEATECVRKEGGDDAFWIYHDTLFANQQALGVDNLIAMAKEQGYDISTCLNSGEFTSEVQKDTRDAQAAGGRGTPYFVINGKPLSGAQPYEAFKAAIDSELA